MNLRRYWPGLVLFVTLVIGAIVGGVGGAVVTSTIAMLVVGPGYLIQQRVRRRRGGAAPSGRVALVALSWVVAGRGWAVAWVGISLTLTLVSFAWRLQRR